MGFVQAGLTNKVLSNSISNKLLAKGWADVFQIPSLPQSPKPLAATLFGLPASAGWTRVSTGFIFGVTKK
jgi:hypothetical protein